MMAMLFCFSSPKEEEYLALSASEVLPDYDENGPDGGQGGPHDEAYDNHVNASLQLAGQQDSDIFDHDDHDSILCPSNNNHNTALRIRPSASIDSIDSIGGAGEFGSTATAAVTIGQASNTQLAFDPLKPLLASAGCTPTITTTTQYRKATFDPSDVKKPASSQHKPQTHSSSPKPVLRGRLALFKSWCGNSGVEHLQQEVLRRSREVRALNSQKRYIPWPSSSSPPSSPTVIRTSTEETKQRPASSRRNDSKQQQTCSQHSLTVDCSSGGGGGAHKRLAHSQVSPSSLPSPSSKALDHERIFLSVKEIRELELRQRALEESRRQEELSSISSTLLSPSQVSHSAFRKKPARPPPKTAGTGSNSDAAPTLPPRAAVPPPRPKAAKPTKRRATSSDGGETESEKQPSTHACMSPETVSLPSRPTPAPRSTSPKTIVTPTVNTSTISPACCATNTMTSVVTSSPSSSSTTSNSTPSANSTAAPASSSQQQQQQQQHSEIHKPSRGWLHPDHKLIDGALGVNYNMRYIGCINVNASMKSLEFEMRSLVAKECINRVCQAAGLKVNGSMNATTGDKNNNKTGARKMADKVAAMLADKPNMDKGGVDVCLSITSAYLHLQEAETGEEVARHNLPNISFASCGDNETIDFAAYVAKDEKYGRACFVLECGGVQKAQDIIATIGQAFELRFKEFLRRTQGSAVRTSPATLPQAAPRSCVCDEKATPRVEDRDYYNDLPGKIPPDLDKLNNNQISERKIEAITDHLIDLSDRFESNTLSAKPNGSPEYVNCCYATSGDTPPPAQSSSEPARDPFDMQPFNGAVVSQVIDEEKPVVPTTIIVSTEDDVTDEQEDASTPPKPMDAFELSPVHTSNANGDETEESYESNDELHKVDWFHGKITREEAESLVVKDGDFLVRDKQSKQATQYVLTGMEAGKPKHLLLVDPEGVVRTKDKTFSSVSHLISFHRSNRLPIVSMESSLELRNPIVRRRPLGRPMSRNSSI